MTANAQIERALQDYDAGALAKRREILRKIQTGLRELRQTLERQRQERARLARPKQCVRREGIGLCDECDQPMWPQKYVGLGVMLCLDCLGEAEENAKIQNPNFKQAPSLKP